MQSCQVKMIAPSPVNFRMLQRMRIDSEKSRREILDCLRLYKLDAVEGVDAFGYAALVVSPATLTSAVRKDNDTIFCCLVKVVLHGWMLNV